MDTLGAIPEPSMAEKVFAQFGRKYRHLLDRSTIYVKSRWGAFCAALFFYCFRVYMLNGWFIVSYGLGIFLLNMFIGFLSPQIDPETDGPLLPTKGEEFRPFSRRVPEFKFWYSSFNAVVVSIFMTFFKFFDIPVFWPILLIYFILLFFLTMRRQIAHMIKHKYVPWSSGKTTYSKKEAIDGNGPSRGFAL